MEAILRIVTIDDSFVIIDTLAIFLIRAIQIGLCIIGVLLSLNIALTKKAASQA